MENRSPVFDPNKPTFLLKGWRKLSTYSNDLVVVFSWKWSDLVNLLRLSWAKSLLALSQHPLMLFMHWRSCCSLTSLSLSNVSTVPQWTGPHSLQADIHISYIYCNFIPYQLLVLHASIYDSFLKIMTIFNVGVKIVVMCFNNRQPYMHVRFHDQLIMVPIMKY